MISILFRNIKYFYEKNYLQGTKINKTSSIFVSGFLHNKNNEILLQRGFRQYGDPSVNNLKLLI